MLSQPQARNDGGFRTWICAYKNTPHVDCCMKSAGVDNHIVLISKDLSCQNDWVSIIAVRFTRLLGETQVQAQVRAPRDRRLQRTCASRALGRRWSVLSDRRSGSSTPMRDHFEYMCDGVGQDARCRRNGDVYSRDFCRGLVSETGKKETECR